MSNIFDDGFGFLAILIVVVVGVVGFAWGTAAIRSDCDKLNSFYLDDKIYICQRVK